MQKGSILEPVIILIALIVIIFLFVLPHNNMGPLRPITPLTGSRSVSTYNPDSRQSITLTTDSSYSSAISLGTGNASYAYQPYEEYITINNRGNSAVNITGWRLKNAKEERSYDAGGNLQKFTSDEAIIPQGALFIASSGSSNFQNIMLASGEKAIITTGSAGSQSPYKIASFKENICSGYLETLPEYSFTPPLTMSCTRPESEPGVSGLDTTCRKFIAGMSSCRMPQYNTREGDGEICENCADHQVLPVSCIAFLKAHYSYAGCLANHRYDANFSLNTWRVFLGKSWEMWAQQFETISILDQFGKLVDYASY